MSLEVRCLTPRPPNVVGHSFLYGSASDNALLGNAYSSKSRFQRKLSRLQDMVCIVLIKNPRGDVYTNPHLIIHVRTNPIGARGLQASEGPQLEQQRIKR